MASDLPSELFTEILSRLPPQSLLRFRSISKSLKSIIDSHNFTNLHLKNSNNFNLILRHNSILYQLDFPDLTTAIPLNHPFTNIALLGSCNGFLCIADGINKNVFWNPNIRKLRILTYLHILPRSKYNILLFCVHGFAFDPFSLDYKLVQISSFFNSQHNTYHSKVRLFSSKTNSWKELPCMLEIIGCTQTMGVFVENSLHWVVTATGNLGTRLILAFNITQEIFNEVPLPEIQVANRKICKIVVSLLGKCLCMTVKYRTPNYVGYQTSKFDVWVMKEYGFRDSWCKLFTLGEWYNKPLRSLKPLGYSSYRSKVLLEVECKNLSSDSISKKLFWYDLKSEEATCVSGIPNFNEAMIYVGSLLRPSLLIDNYNYRKENRPQFKYESKSKRRLN